MQRKFLTVVALFFICVGTVVLTMHSGLAQDSKAIAFETPTPETSAIAMQGQEENPLFSTACALQPERNPSQPSATLLAQMRRVSGSLTIDRFRKVEAIAPDVKRTSPIAQYIPNEEVEPIDPTNYGERYLRDINGNPAQLDPIVVLHETVGSATSAINLFQTPHPNDDDQASYHSLIRLDGTIVYLVPPDKRAFGAGNSAFMGSNGLERVNTNPTLPGSVNNFAYHISLETPVDGNHNGYRHSGYTQAQYQSLAWLVSKTDVPSYRITTHREVDRSGSRIDPRSFNDGKFAELLNSYPKAAEINIRCTEPTSQS